jgi:hypothetical protein
MTNHDTMDQPSLVDARVLPITDEPRPLFDRIRIECPRIGRERTGAECSQCERFLEWHTSATGRLGVVCRLPCAACGDRDHGAEMAGVTFCDDCRERAVAGEDDELGTGD